MWSMESIREEEENKNYKCFTVIENGLKLEYVIKEKLFEIWNTIQTD